MLVTRQDIIILKNLSTTKELIAVDGIPSTFKKDFQLFFFGKTFLKKDDTLFAYPHDIKKWTRFMFNKYNG
ncbi:hypothetical protein [Flavobacterium columnare]|uniref:Uncharacterized protein n=1 Tax=Flavobacterium columnare TaxID=996 RepID=A0AAI8CFL6_9FLAO|nr:hypothetical protein [Flavobacterium columnare]AMO19047.1 hypothetical protein UN65_00575 [Flavobacterium columnare]AUX16970.1 hypothetical protein AQ623_00600 [Flavobacterium columnare]MEB3799808.1 hypothetical protein [Flavobacterium columnare]QOG55980.1 hypothetical protein HUE29_00580 [Flavobacterium columnare]QOG58702.1 hypothetical protein HUE30_00580 [Flavobacterium columnare]